MPGNGVAGDAAKGLSRKGGGEGGKVGFLECDEAADEL
jgi:hypothetical protein